jgi:hypothetical protein
MGGNKNKTTENIGEGKSRDSKIEAMRGGTDEYEAASTSTTSQMDVGDSQNILVATSTTTQ